MTIEPQIRYAQAADGVSIAFWTLGEGRAVFMDSPLTFSHCGLEPRIPAIAALYEHVAANAMLVRWDKRNYGMSQRGIADLGIEAFATDVIAVADAIGADDFDVIGLNNYPTVAALRPDRVRRVALVAPPPLRLAELLDDPDQAAVRSLTPTNWDVFTETDGSFLQVGTRTRASPSRPSSARASTRPTTCASWTPGAGTTSPSTSAGSGVRR